MGKAIRCCVIGAGRIGLPISISLALAVHDITILEKDSFRVAMINNGKVPFHEAEMEESLRYMKDEDRIRATTNAEIIKDCEIIVSAIGTGLNEDGSPDLDSIEQLLNIISPNFVKGSLIILKTTLPIGMTDLITKKLCELTNLKMDEDVLVAFSPERIVEGKAMEELRTLPKIIGGVGPKSTEKAKQFLSTLGGEIIIVKNTKTAEMCKLLDNSYRMTRFGFAADVASIAVINGIDAYEAINAANSDYPRNNIPLPSIGVSGYCLTKDPYYLDTAAPEIWKNRGFPSTWITARRAADIQIKEAFNRIRQELGGVESKVIVIGGITYKEDVDDTRLSHGRELVKLFLEAGAEVRIWDPIALDKIILDIEVNKTEECLVLADCLVVTVPHSKFIDWAKHKKGIDKMRKKFIFDGWGIFPRDGDKKIKSKGTGR